ncbi:hypothetical protein BIWAKO_00564 [Bosea sp. BIWAKO-01]|nr:hypothetical protein BIWAKO_00564 [Bosea sp. BIWAKO-01]
MAAGGHLWAILRAGARLARQGRYVSGRFGDCMDRGARGTACPCRCCNPAHKRQRLGRLLQRCRAECGLKSSLTGKDNIRTETKATGAGGCLIKSH